MIYEHDIPEDRIQQRVEQGPVRTRDAVNSFHDRMGLAITVAVGSMWCAYLFAVLAMISAPSALTSGNMLVIVGWIAQTFLQLVLLPIIIVGQNVQAKASDKRAEQTFDDVELILTMLRQHQEHLAAQDRFLEGRPL